LSTDAFAKPDPAADDEDPADRHIADALGSLRQAIDHYGGCTEEEKDALRRELSELQAMDRKLRAGRVEIVLFGEIDTGKSALINALVGRTVAAVDVRGGWTKEVWDVPWEAQGVRVPGLEHSSIVLLDTPGINEVAGEERAKLAHNAATRADLILFVTDSDLNQTEYAALAELAACHKPIVLVFNKTDNYTPDQRATLKATFTDGRLRGIIEPEDLIETTADPLPREYIIESADGSTRSETRQPKPNVETLKLRILEVLASEGKALLALNAAMYAADRSDRITAVKMRMRDERANAVIWSYAVMKSVGVAITADPLSDIVGGSAVDLTMVVTLAHIYGIPLTWMNAQKLIASIFKAAGYVMASEIATRVAASFFKLATFGIGHALVALPQGAAAGYGSYIVGQAAKFYLEHGASWGDEAPKSVVSRILAATDKQTVVARLRDEISKKLHMNKHAGKS
jgi:GTPase